MSQVNPRHNFYDSEVISMKFAWLYVKVTSQAGMATILGPEYMSQADQVWQDGWLCQNHVTLNKQPN